MAAQTLSERDFGVGHWTCIVTHDAATEFDMVSGDVVEKNDKGVTISVEHTLGPNHDIFYPFKEIYEKVS